MLSGERQEVDNRNWDLVLNNSRKTYEPINRRPLANTRMQIASVPPVNPLFYYL